MTFEIAAAGALEILDSRGRPALSVTVTLAGERLSSGERVAKYNRLMQIASQRPGLP